MKARLAKKILKSLQHHVLKDGDMLVLRVPTNTPPDQFMRLQAALKPIFPNHRVLVMARDVSIEVVSAPKG